MAWIKIRNDIEDDPAVISIAAATGLHTDHVVGKLRRIWAWADEQTYDGNAAGVTAAWIDAKVGVTGFAAAMMEVKWLELTNQGIAIPNFDRHNGQTAKDRILTAKRVAKHKAKSNGVGNGEVTEPPLTREEKIREEKSIGGKPPITPSGDRKKPFGVTLPPTTSPQFAEAWAAWQRHLSEKPSAKRPTRSAVQKQLEKVLALGEGRAIAAIELSIERNWQSIFEESHNGNGTTHAPARINPFTGKPI